MPRIGLAHLSLGGKLLLALLMVVLVCRETGTSGSHSVAGRAIILETCPDEVR